jgi:hypothetical protein
MSGRLARANPPVKPRGQPQYLQPSKQPQPTYSQAQPRNLPPQPPGMMHVTQPSYQYQPNLNQPNQNPNQYQFNQYQPQPQHPQQQQPAQLGYNQGNYSQEYTHQLQPQQQPQPQAPLPPTEKRMPTKIGSGPGMVSINDAFAGATLRLSSIEQFILDLKAGSVAIPGDTNMLRGVMSRIEAIEKNLAKLGARLDAQEQTHVHTQVIIPTPTETTRQWNQQQQQWPPVNPPPMDLCAEDVDDDTDDEDLQGAVAYEFGAQSQLD